LVKELQVIATGHQPSDDLGRLYAKLGNRLHKQVRAGVVAPEAVIEDACQLAWSRLIGYRQRVQSEKALGWLATTATHEAVRLLGREQREESLERQLEQRGEEMLHNRAPSAEEVLELRQRLCWLSGVPNRQKRLLWLQAMGLDYDEMARHEGCTRRTVERQLLRAQRAVRRPVA
jgi:RNA polymerase sigma factor (sigma-70 family)